MLYFKNVELSEIYHVSEGAVRRWIEGARQGRLDLQLYEHNGRDHIANTAKNKRIIEGLIARNKKFSKAHKVTTPNSVFYSLYTPRQIIDIAVNLDMHREIPLQYDYFGEGAQWFDAYSHRLWEEQEANALTATVDLLGANADNLRSLLGGYERVNVIDIGVGNGLPVKELLTHLAYDEDILGRYIGIDISADMLKVAEQNLNSWLQGIEFEGHVRDITFERFDDLLINEDPSTTANIVLLLGGTINNFKWPDEVLRVIYHSMGRNSLLVTARKLDTPDSRRYFDFHAGQELPRLSRNHTLMLSHLGINESMYEVEQGYDDEKHMRFIKIILKVDLVINFTINNKKRPVYIQRGESILLWRAWHQNTFEVIEQLRNNGFTLEATCTTPDESFLLTISRARRESLPSLKAT